MEKNKVQVNARIPEVERRRLRMLAVQRGLNIEQALLQAVQTWLATAKPGELPPTAPQPRAPQQRPAARAARARQEAVAKATATKSHVSAKPAPKRRATANSNRPVARATRPRAASVSNRAPSVSKAMAADPLAEAARRAAATTGLDPGELLALVRGAGEAGSLAEVAGSRPPSPRNQPQGDTAAWPERALALDWSQCAAAERIRTNRGPTWVFRGTRRPLWDLFHNLQRGYSVDTLMEHFPDLNDEQVDAVIQFAHQQMVIPEL